MMIWPLLLFLFAAPFWEAKPPADWTADELEQLFTDSPWAQMVKAPGRVAPGPAVQVYLATAAAMDQAERERARRSRRQGPADALAEDYQAWLKENRASQIVLAVRIASNAGFFDEREVRRMEEECVMRVGRKKFKTTGHFPPSASDPYLRLAFPREVQPRDKSVVFELYLPGVPIPDREAEFSVKEMTVRGKLEM
jgi:hypothetical protein